jgi:hypothetical protein
MPNGRAPPSAFGISTCRIGKVVAAAYAITLLMNGPTVRMLMQCLLPT